MLSRCSLVVLFSLLCATALAEAPGAPLVDELRQRMPFVDRHMALPTYVPGDRGATVGEHCQRVLRTGRCQLPHYDLAGISRRAGFDVKRVLELTFALHDIGKGRAVETHAPDRAANLRVVSRLASRRGRLGTAEREIAKNISAGLHDQERFNLPLMTAAMRKLGLPHRQIALARSLVGADLVGSMMTGRCTVAQARRSLDSDATRLRLPAKDLLRMHQLFHAADAGSYNQLRHSFASRNGKLLARSYALRRLAQDVGLDGL